MQHIKNDNISTHVFHHVPMIQLWTSYMSEGNYTMLDIWKIKMFSYLNKCIALNDIDSVYHKL